MKLYYEDILLCEVMTNHSMSIDDILNLMEIDMDAFAAEQGWEDWDWDQLRIEI